VSEHSAIEVEPDMNKETEMSIRCLMQCFCLTKALESQTSYSAHAITVHLWYLVPEKIDRFPRLCIRVCTGATIRARVCVIIA